MSGGVVPPMALRLTASLSAARPRLIQLSPLSFQLQSRVDRAPIKCGRPHTATFDTSTSKRRGFSSLTRRQNATESGLPQPPRVIEAENENGKEEDEHRDEEPQLMPKSNNTERIRRLMRTVSHPVAVVTAREKGNENPDRNYQYGATVSSFTTVALNPEPMVAFNLHESSVTLATIITSRLFAVTLLQNNAKGAALAERFAKGNKPSPFDDPNVRWTTQWSKTSVAKSIGPARVALRADGEGKSSAFSILCELTQIVPVGDHRVVIGRSLDAKIQSGHSWGGVGENPSLKISEEAGKKDICLNYTHGHFSHLDVVSKPKESVAGTDPETPIWVLYDRERNTDIFKLDEHGAKKLYAHYQKLVIIYRNADLGRKTGGQSDVVHYTTSLSDNEVTRALEWFKWRRSECTARINLLVRFPSMPKVSNPQLEPPLTAGEESLLRVKSSMLDSEIAADEEDNEARIHTICTEIEKIKSKGDEIDQVFFSASTLDDLEEQRDTYIRKLQILQELKRRKKSVSDQTADQSKEARRSKWEHNYLGGVIHNSLPVLRSMLKFHLQLQDRKLDEGSDSESEQVELSAEALAQRVRLIQSAVELKLRHGPDFGVRAAFREVEADTAKDRSQTTEVKPAELEKPVIVGATPSAETTL